MSGNCAFPSGEAHRKLSGMHSMTGFGRGSASASPWLATVEISSVNRKQAEVVVQTPRELAELEARIRKQVLQIVSRGRIQVSINVEQEETTDASVQVNPALAHAFDAAFAKLSKAVGHPLLPTAADYLRQPGIITISAGAINPDAAWLAIEPALKEALAQLATMRAREGADLKKDFQDRIGVLIGFTDRIAADAPQRLSRQRELLAKRLRDAGLGLDPADERVAKEIAIFADRCDVTEELTRLASHFAKFHEYLDAADAPGRALDFLCQELFREFNTIGSKANDASIAQTIVEAKTELEKIREQVQNVE